MHFLITISLNVMMKKRRKMILGPKMTIFPILGIMQIFLQNPKQSLEITFNACHQVQDQKNLFRKIE